MAGVDVSVHTPPSTRGPIRGPQGEPGPQGPRGETGSPGDPAELLAPLSPGDALSVDGAGRPTALAVVGKLPPGSGNRIVVTNNAGVEVPYAVTQQAPTANAIVQRTAAGQAVVAEGTEPNHAVSKAQLDTKPITPANVAITTTTGGNRVPSLTSATGTWDANGRALSTTPIASSIPFRDASGHVKTTDAVAADDAVTKAQLDGRLSAAQRTAINALPATGATTDQIVAALRAT